MTPYQKLLQSSQKYLFTNQPKKAIAYANKAKRIKQNDHHIYDILAESYMLIEKFDKAKEAGLRSLYLKELQASHYPTYPKPQHTIKKFNTSDRNKNIISFSLFGDNPKYCESAVLNARRVAEIYPHWSCRFYCDTKVPSSILKRLEEEGASLVIQETPDDRSKMLLWRFLVMGDESVDRYLIRDCDALITSRESRAVEEWIASGKRFHIMRDYYTHTDLMLAGMFGGTTDMFPHIAELIEDFYQTKDKYFSHQDQLFLRHYIWSSIKDDLLAHDRCFRFQGALEFPHTSLNSTQHIGQNEASMQITVDLPNIADNTKVSWAIYDKSDTLICRYTTQVINSSWSTYLPNSYVDKLKSGEFIIKYILE